LPTIIKTEPVSRIKAMVILPRHETRFVIDVQSY
jgi:hypothetical protein